MQFPKWLRIYWYSKSTALITPVFFVFITTEKGISTEQILKLSALSSFLSLILEVPTGLLADRFGYIWSLLLSVFLQAVSILFLLFSGTEVSYPAYLFCIVVAGSFLNGADIGLVKNVAKFGQSGQEFREMMTDLNSSFYRLTAAFLAIGGVLYWLSPKLPFYAQIISFALCGYSLVYGHRQMRSNSLGENIDAKNLKIKQDNESSFLKRFATSADFFHSMVLLVLVINSALSQSAISLNQKTVQQQFNQLMNFSHSPIFLGLLFAVGNFFSSYGLKYFSLLINKLNLRSFELIAVSFLLVSSLSMMFSSQPIVFSFGYFLFCSFKSVSRNVMQIMTVEIGKSTPSLATFLSMIALLSALTAAGIQYAIGEIFGQSQSLFLWSSIVIGCLAVLFSVVAIIVSRIERSRTRRPIFSQKIVHFPLSLSRRYVTYEYSNKDDLSRGLMGFETAFLNRPKVFPFSIGESGFSVSRIDGKCISELSPDAQISFVQRFFKDYFVASRSVERCALHFRSSFDIVDFRHRLPLETAEKLYSEDFLSLVHGDLNSSNIMLTQDSYFVIDWDNSGIGYWWVDVLQLVFCPALSIPFESRLQILSHYLNDMSAYEVERIAFEFVHLKLSLFKRFDDVRDGSSVSKVNAGLQKLIFEATIFRADACSHLR